MNGPLPNPMHELSVERVDSLDEADLAELCEATDAAIAEGGGFGWIMPQGREILERHFRGVMLVPERQLSHAYIAPYARGHGLARLLMRRVEERAAALGHRVLNLDVRATQHTAIALLEACGYIRWGTHPAYARVEGATVPGHYYYKLLEPGRGRRGKDRM